MSQPTLVYSDVSKYVLKHRRLGRDKALGVLSRRVENHFGDEIWYPAFNYDCLKTGVFHYHSDPSQVGALGEHNRVNGYTRSIQPVFNVVSNARHQRHLDTGLFNKSPLRLFGDSYIFRELVDRNGSIVWLGLPYDKLATVTHLAETDSGGVDYRFDKTFSVSVFIATDERYDINVMYNVRPTEDVVKLEYDKELRRVITESLGSFRISEFDGLAAFSVSARELYEAYMNVIASDRFGLLTDGSKRECTELARKHGEDSALWRQA